MLAKKYRFHGYNSLRFAYTKGKVTRSKYISLKSSKNNRRVDSRVAVVVSKKVTKKAPVRNRIRRRIYEAMQANWSNIQPGHDIIVTIFDERVAHEPHEKLVTTIQKLLSEAHLLDVQKEHPENDRN
jgi:ribonuclease P protein component